MRTIIHLSDLHFGRSLPALIAPLLAAIKARAPHLLVISGDLTQRARISQFRQAQNFLALLPCPILSVPGNHDIPLYAVWTRLVNPFKRYQRYVSEELDPQYLDDEIAVRGVNSVRRLKFKEGRINRRQLELAQKFFSAVPTKVVKIIVAHHPFNLPEEYPGKYIQRARLALDCFHDLGIDLLLSGHLHSTLARYKNAVYKLDYRRPLIIQAGTTISSRLRLEPNSFNVIEIDYPRLRLERYELDNRTLAFLPARTEHFIRGPEAWEPGEKSPAV
jgi:3',5'-cyclic AMP phosphodiesterase CpdA